MAAFDLRRLCLAVGLLERLAGVEHNIDDNAVADKNVLFAAFITSKETNLVLAFCLDGLSGAEKKDQKKKNGVAHRSVTEWTGEGW